MQSRRHAPETEDTGIALAPMLDFTTNLLIFFIITTSFIKEAGTVTSRGSGCLLTARAPRTGASGWVWGSFSGLASSSGSGTSTTLYTVWGFCSQ